jgi:hypothetical protein
MLNQINSKSCGLCDNVENDTKQERSQCADMWNILQN